MKVSDKIFKSYHLISLEPVQIFVKLFVGNLKLSEFITFEKPNIKSGIL